MTASNANPEADLPASTQTDNIRIFVTAVIIIFLMIGSSVAGYQFAKIKSAQNESVENQTTYEHSDYRPTTTPDNLDTVVWKTNTLGFFSYEYPQNWHVVELWSENYSQNGLLILMDTKPINTAPRGGSIATFEINILNGNDNPDEILTENINEFNKDNYTDISKETIPAGIGEVYYYKGKMAGEMMLGTPVEKYYFTFNKKPGDSLNQQVVIATMVNQTNPSISDMFRHVALSFKESGKN